MFSTSRRAGVPVRLSARCWTPFLETMRLRVNDIL